MEQIKGKIAAILDRTAVVINRGSLDGVSKGLAFYIYSELGPFYDPDTGENLGTITRVWGRVVVSNVADRLCIARTEYKDVQPWNLSVFRTVFGERVQIRLPVNETEISGWPSEVHVGSEVISERPTPAAIAAEDEVETLPAPSETLIAPPTVTSEDSEEAHSPQGESDTAVQNDSHNCSE
jgi:hypothetical protein